MLLDPQLEHAAEDLRILSRPSFIYEVKISVLQQKIEFTSLRPHQ